MHTSVVAAYWTFAVAAAVLVMMPGLDTALVLRTAASEGIRNALSVALGACCGVLVWGAAVAFGLGALFDASHVAYTVLRWAGAAYLCYVGAGMFIRPRGSFVLAEGVTGDGRSTVPQSYRRGLLTNLLNPKVGVFYATFLPQFVPAGVRIPWFMVSLSIIHAAEGIVWFVALLTVARPALVWLRRPSVLKAMERATGTVLIAFGARLVLSER